MTVLAKISFAPEAPLKMPSDEAVRAFLRPLLRDDARHASFLNMLSMLEHMGSRKIMLSQMNRVMGEDTLKHLAEEARHAFFFKRQAERIAGGELTGYTPENTFARAAATMYFGRLAAMVHGEVGDDAAYPWTTRIVEIRACWFYELYEDELRKAGHSLSLRSILAEEEGHLADMDKRCGADNKTVLENLLAREEPLFARLWAGIVAA